MKQFAYISLALSLTAFTACNDEGADFETAAANVEGIYKLSSYTRNDNACEPGGRSLLGQDQFAVAFTQTIVGYRVLTVASCASAADCRAKLADLRAQEPVPIDFMFSFDSARAPDVLVAAGASTGFGNGRVCSGAEVFDTQLERVGTQLRIEQAITIADDYAADSNGFCTTERAREHAEGKLCTQMEALTAELLEVL